MEIKFNFLNQQPNGVWMGMSTAGVIYYYDEKTGRAERGKYITWHAGYHQYFLAPVTDPEITKQIAIAVMEKKNEAS